MTSQPPPFEIAIIGGGISGLVLTIALLARSESLPLKIKVYEAAQHFAEIGAGVAFSPNALRAMELCSPDISAAYEKVATTNLRPEKKGTWFDFLDGMGPEAVGQGKWLFDLTNSLGQNAVHRAHFLDELVKLVPDGSAEFGKRLESIDEDASNGRLKLAFHDGSSAEADAVIGCDGIKSRVRAILYGEDHPSTHPVYCLLYTSPSPRDRTRSRMPSSA